LNHQKLKKMEQVLKILNEGNNKGTQQGGKLNEGQERGNRKVVTTPKPVIVPAPQKVVKK